jgi:hypothetical protein
MLMDDDVPLTIPELAGLLRSSTAAIEGEIHAAPPRVLTWHPALSEWCIKEVLGHLIEADRRGFAGRVRVIVESENPELAGWDPQEVARARHDCERNAGELLQEFLVRRHQGIQLLERLTPADAARSGRHPTVGNLSVGGVVNEWVHHDRNHLKQLLSNVQGYLWPHLGAAQGFSGPQATRAELDRLRST